MSNIQLPPQFNWVDLSNSQFSTALEYCLDSNRNLFVQGQAGTGKSIMIKILAKMLKNTVILSTTGITAVELSTEDIPVKTLHSFLCIPPTAIFTDDDLLTSSYKNNKLLNSAETIIIDEVSMMSNSLFDFVCEKIRKLRRDHQVPRFILFGDVMQLPPVVSFEHPIVADYFKERYDNNIMFFNSDWYKDLKFKTLILRKSYRQADEEFAEKLTQISYRDHSSETLDYFNQRVMPLPNFEAAHKNFIYMSPTNAVVDRINNQYMSTLTGQLMTYHASMSKGFPTSKKPNTDKVDIREGAQIMCLVNNYEEKYVNGTIGEVTDVYKDHLIIDHKGVSKKIRRTRFNIYDLELNSSGDLSRRVVGWYEQIDAKVCRAITIHKCQGKTLDSAYISLGKWVPEGITYVALSRLRSLDGLGLSRPLVDSDIQVNKEAFQFLES
jgi:ATP-dependent exoDNAse (exonuclease V) alpha subunit